ncbi:MAG: DUF4139 domain-containing protein [Gemmataceae bacterium]|nr:DUF4139 domain-containing protein [Gemmataceae bacterium]
MRRAMKILAAAGATAATTVAIWLINPTTAQQPVGGNGPASARVAAPALPVSQVVLFSSGVGYFQREGQVEGNSRVDLSFADTDVNDLLKSLVLQDLGGGKVTAIGYDSQDPIEKTLKSFALDLTNNPSFGQIINQARGEKIELTMQQTNNTQPATMTGVVVGMEAKKDKNGAHEIELLNILCAEGMRSVSLDQVQRLRFLNPALDSEFRRALDVLATSHDTQKKAVSVNFKGEGKRTVRIGYVVESPIWKTSYRLVQNKDGSLYLQGWAAVENTTSEDWNNIRMVLVSGRPISFQMNMYQPLYIPRPTVELERFASLRPPTYNGSLGNQQIDMAGGQNVNPQERFGFNRYQSGNALSFNPNHIGNANNNNRLTYAEMQQRKQQQQEVIDKARKMGSTILMDPREGVASIATAEEAGDYFQYQIDERVNLPRQKSALLPILDEKVTGRRVSIFNESVHGKFPLLGMKFKNSSTQHLTQGPITVYDGGTYAGDARIMDLQPGEERLISYAVDLGTEVKAESKTTPDQLVSVKVVKGIMHAQNKLRQTKTYLVRNRSEHDRMLIVEHPINKDFKLVSPEKADERSRDSYRFEVAVPAGKTVTFPVVEERTRQDSLSLSSSDDRTVRIFMNSNVSTPAVKEALRKAVTLRTERAATERDRIHLEQQLKTITDDQTRLRANLDKVPPTSEAYKRYLEKFDKQETEIEKLQAQIQQKREAEKKQQTEYEDFLIGLTVE